MPARVMCTDMSPTSIDKLNSEINNLMHKGYEPIKMVGIGEENISRICLLLIKK